MDFQTLKLELEKRCRDLGQIKRPATRYGEALNTAVSQYPRALWARAIDGTTLDTVADQREYALSGISAITEPWQVKRIWIDDSDGIKRETGRWEVQDNAGTLALVLDEAPSGAYDLTLEYATPPAAMTQPTDTTQADDEWLLAKAAVALLGEADWEIEGPQYLASELEYWNAVRAMREQQLRRERRRVPRKLRTTAWRSYV